MLTKRMLLTGVVAIATGMSGLFTAASAEDKSLNFVMVTHSPSSDPYWASVVSGLEQAGKQLGVTVTYRGTDKNLHDPNQQKRNIEAAIASKPDGLIITDPTPDSLNDSISKATSAGIPVILINQGGDQVKKVGALTFVGDDPGIQGKIGAEQFNLIGSKHALVINHADRRHPFC